MAKIPLRVYTKEIENLIEQGEIEQAISHAKNILKTYPKHIETYRLLGKAFLESQRYAEAADILQRVLSVIPDDFISQIGMSIIREDEGNLDAAIWHMERAYEVQPFNPAVQDELKRLYGRRDGVEPPKIRLTRGALIRMYTRGELYPQAIAETRAALTEDPQRADLQVLLARLYYLSGHKNDSAAICSELISKLPYCYEANHLLTLILPGTTRAEEARKFQQRIYALEPYEAFISPSAPSSDQVPDQAIMIEPMAATSLDGEMSPAWAQTVGVQWEESPEEVIPEWLNTLGSDQTGSEPQPPQQILEEPSAPSVTPVNETLSIDSTTDQEAPSDDSVPAWLKEAGWTKSERSADEIMAEQGNNQFDEEIAPADIPDWLKSIAPQDASPVDNKETGSGWFEALVTPAGSPTSHDAGVPEDLSTISQDPNFNEELGTEGTPSAEKDDLPEWLSRIAEEETSTESPTEPPLTLDETDVLPDWIKGGENTQEQIDLPVDEITQQPAAVDNPTDVIPGSQDGQPDWLSSFAESNAAEAEPTVNTDWLKGIEPRFEESEGEVPTPQPVDLSGTPEESSPAEPAVTSPDLPPAPDLSDTDAMMAWLESLAARQGADEATLITPPDQRTETPPEWVINEVAADQAAEVDTAQPQAGSPEEKSDLQETSVPSSKPIDEFPAPVDSTFDQTKEITIEQFAAPHPEEAGSKVFHLDEDEESMAWMDALMTNAGKTVEETDFEVPGREIPEANPIIAEKESSIPYQPDQIGEAQGDQPQEVLGAATPSVNEETQSETQLEAFAGQDSEEPTQPVRVTKTVDQSAVPAGETQEPMASPSTSSAPDYNDTDAMMAWLESLAAKQGADEATLLTPPDLRTDTPPEWVTKEIEQSDEAEPLALEQPQPQPEASESVPSEEVPDWLTGIEEENESEASFDVAELPTQTDDFRTAWAPEIQLNEPQISQPIETSRPADEANLNDLNDALQHGEIQKALTGYSHHIQQGQHLDETIQSLRDALYRYPVDITIWQTLGDAYAQNNQLQEALDAYTKAEELLR